MTTTTATSTGAPVVPTAAVGAGAVTGSAAAAATPYATASLYVGDLRSDVSESQLFDIFKNVGTVASIRVCRDAVTRRSLGYSYVNFHNVADAERALDTMNYTLILGKPCRIMWSHRDPARRRSGSGNIFIKNLDKSVNNQQLYDTFSAFGNILSCKVETDDNGGSKGYGYVHFEKEEDARNATEKVNGMLIAGKKVFVGPFLSRRERYKDGALSGRETHFTNVYVKNLDESVNDEGLAAAFAKFGEITSAVVMRNAEGQSRGFGFVNFKEHEPAKTAVTEMSNQTIGAKQVVVCRAQKKSERERELHRKFETKGPGAADGSAAGAHAGVNVYVRNLDESFSDDDLRQLFTPFGTITSAKVMRDEKGTSKGFGFVCYGSPEEAHKAISEINGVLVQNKPLYVALAQKKEFRREQLEAQHAQRLRVASASMAAAVAPPSAAFMPQSAPIYYGGAAAQRYMMAAAAAAAPPQMMTRGGWRGMPGGAGHRGGYPQLAGFGGMIPMGRSGRPQVRNRGGPMMMKDPVTGALIPAGPAGPVMQPGWRGGYKLSPAARNQYPLIQPVPPIPQVPQAQPMAPETTAPAAPAAVPVATDTAPASAAAPEEAPAQAAVDYSAMGPDEVRQAIGERLFGVVYVQYPSQQQRCGKITGMLLESMEVPDLIKLLGDREALSKKIEEANVVYEAHQRKIADATIAAEVAATTPPSTAAGQPAADASSEQK